MKDGNYSRGSSPLDSRPEDNFTTDFPFDSLVRQAAAIQANRELEVDLSRFVASSIDRFRNDPLLDQDQLEVVISELERCGRKIVVDGRPKIFHCNQRRFCPNCGKRYGKDRIDQRFGPALDELRRVEDLDWYAVTLTIPNGEVGMAMTTIKKAHGFLTRTIREAPSLKKRSSLAAIRAGLFNLEIPPAKGSSDWDWVNAHYHVLFGVDRNTDPEDLRESLSRAWRKSVEKASPILKEQGWSENFYFEQVGQDGTALGEKLEATMAYGFKSDLGDPWIPFENQDEEFFARRIYIALRLSALGLGRIHLVSPLRFPKPPHKEQGVGVRESISSGERIIDEIEPPRSLVEKFKKMQLEEKTNRELDKIFRRRARSKARPRP